MFFIRGAFLLSSGISMRIRFSQINTVINNEIYQTAIPIGFETARTLSQDAILFGLVLSTHRYIPISGLCSVHAFTSAEPLVFFIMLLSV